MRLRLVILGALWVMLSGALAAIELSRQPEMVIRWATETEVDTLGFNLYRATTPEGPFQQINLGLIPGATDPLAGAEYEYVDAEVRAGRHYYYQLEEVENDGTSSRVELAGGTAVGSRWSMVALSGCGFLVGAFLVINGSRRPARSRAIEPEEEGAPRDSSTGANNG